MRLGRIAEILGLTLRGDAQQEVTAVAPIHRAGPGQLSFLSDAKYRKQLADCRAGALILTAADAPAFSGNALISSNPYASYARALQLLYPEDRLQAGIDPGAVLHASATVAASARVDAFAVIGADAYIGEGVWIGAGVVIGERCRIGANSRIYPQVVVYADTEIGKNCVIHAGSVLGSDGFGYAPDKNGYVKIPQIGRLCLGDGVEVGANAAIDRGALEDTVIADGVKIDNLVHIAHNVQIGADTVVAAQTGFAGSTVVGRRCMFGGQVGVTGHVRLADGVVLSGKSMVTKSLDEPGVYSSGMPAEKNSTWRRQVARVRQLDVLYERIAALEKALALTQVEEETS